MSFNQLLRVPCGCNAQSIALREAIAALPPEQGEIAYRRIVVGESSVDVAEDIGRDAEYVDRLCREAVETLKRIMGA